MIGLSSPGNLISYIFILKLCYVNWLGGTLIDQILKFNPKLSHFLLGNTLQGNYPVWSSQVSYSPRPFRFIYYLASICCFLLFLFVQWYLHHFKFFFFKVIILHEQLFHSSGYLCFGADAYLSFNFYLEALDWSLCDISCLWNFIPTTCQHGKANIFEQWRTSGWWF